MYKLFERFSQQAMNDTNELPIELTNTTGTYLQNINEDCLLEIFSVKSLTLMDLCSLAETCKLFQQIIQRVFPKDIGICISPHGHYEFTARHYLNSREHGACDAERILKNFGSLSVAISITNWNPMVNASNFVLILLTKYCVNTLKVLKLYAYEAIKISKDLTAQLKPILKQLEILHLNRVAVEETLSADFDALIELNVSRVNNCGAILENFFPKLKRLTHEAIEQNDESLTTFIPRHSNLKMITVLADIEENVLQVIGNGCNKLEELTLNMLWKDLSFLQPLQASQSLKTLCLHYALCQDFGFIASMTNLRAINLARCILPDDSNQFAALAHTTKMCIFECDVVLDTVVDMIRQLICLEELMIYNISFILDEVNFSKIVGIVKDRPKVLTLQCRFNFNLKNSNQNQMLRLLPLW